MIFPKISNYGNSSFCRHDYLL